MVLYSQYCTGQLYMFAVLREDPKGSDSRIPGLREGRGIDSRRAQIYYYFGYIYIIYKRTVRPARTKDRIPDSWDWDSWDCGESRGFDSRRA
jgi:hypothetical protein